MPPKAAPAPVAGKAASTYPPNQTLYITNLPSSKIQKYDLRLSLYTLFSTYGPVLDVVAMKTMKMRGQAHVVYRDAQTATQAMRALRGFEFFGYELDIQYAKSKSDTIAKLDGTFHKPAAAAGEVTATELQQSIFNAPPSAAFLAGAGAPGTAGGAALLKPPPALGRDTAMEDARSPTTSVAGEKRKREEEDEEAASESGSDVAMEEDTPDAKARGFDLPNPEPHDHPHDARTTPMNVLDPFNLRRSPALAILRGATAQTAANITRRAIAAGAASSLLHSGRRLAEDMAFSIPKNVPSFTDPQRELENRAWGSSGVTARSAAAGSGMQERLGSYFERNKDYFDGGRQLPLYKDKPYSSSRRRRPLWKYKRAFALIGLFIMFVLYLFGVWGNDEEKRTVKKKGKDGWGWLQNADKKVDWPERQQRVVEAFTLSWDAYERYAWGFDEFHPVSKKGKQMTPKGMGWIIVDALDTLMLMNLTSRLTEARKWVGTKLDYDQDQEVNTFETTIRMIGGLLSAHYLSTEFPDMAPIEDDDPGAPGEDLYLEKAKDLADRVIGAFESDSGVPYASVNLKTMKGVPSHTDGGASSTAEAATLQLEFKYLSKLTGETFYWEKAEKVMEVIDGNGVEDGLVPIFIYAPTGEFRGDNIRLGSRGDSYYEYLIKQYLQTSKQEPVYEEMWDQAIGGVRKHLISYSKPSKFTVLGERQNGLKGPLTGKMDHLLCFLPGTIALGATGGISEAEARRSGSWGAKQDEDMKLARELMHTCWGMYKSMATGLAAEITHFNLDDPPLPESAPHKAPTTFDPAPGAEWRKDFVVKANDRHNLQRPETVESLFYMWRITGDVMYREWGWEMFKSFMEHTAVELGGGFTSLRNADVIPPEMADNMESFWLAETLKYFYLLFGPNDVWPLDKIVINTEAHAFPRFQMGKLFKTGWQRKPRGKDGNIVRDAVVEAAASKGAHICEIHSNQITAGRPLREQISSTPTSADIAVLRSFPAHHRSPAPAARRRRDEGGVY
ncbi:hypothetical protein V492_06767 [Pseudogymnoascus sp. VKM F-4246]|nr:hypothetical protein V492_06767 [Pseudogymnoascus sp. VKM F-4246]